MGIQDQTGIPRYMVVDCSATSLLLADRDRNLVAYVKRITSFWSWWSDCYYIYTVHRRYPNQPVSIRVPEKRVEASLFVWHSDSTDMYLCGKVFPRKLVTCVDNESKFETEMKFLYSQTKEGKRNVIGYSAGYPSIIDVQRNQQDQVLHVLSGRSCLIAVCLVYALDHLNDKLHRKDNYRPEHSKDY
jgi:hypothetical protein